MNDTTMFLESFEDIKSFNSTIMFENLFDYNIYLNILKEIIIIFLIVIIFYQNYSYNDENCNYCEKDLEKEEMLKLVVKSLQNNIDTKFNLVDTNTRELKDKISDLENDIIKTLKMFNKRISKLNEQYSYIECIIDELYDYDDSDTSDSDYEPEPEPKENKKININIKNHNDKSFLVYGDTKQVKEELKKLGGKWNPHLHGWIFSNTHKDKVSKWVNKNC